MKPADSINNRKELRKPGIGLGGYLVIAIIPTCLIASAFAGYNYCHKNPDACRPQDPKINIEAIGIRGLAISERGTEGLFTIEYNVPGKQDSENFIINVTEDKPEEHSTLNIYSPFFNCAERSNRKLVYLVLDVSGSVTNLNKWDKRKAQIAGILRSDKYAPGDRFVIKFLGEDNDETVVLDYAGPRLVVGEVRENNVYNVITIPITDYLPNEKPLGCDGNRAVSSISEIFEIMGKIYDERSLNEDSTTKFVDMLEKINGEVRNMKANGRPFKSITYAIFSDGDSQDGFDGCGEGEFGNCGESITDIKNYNSELDKVHIVGVFPEYRDSISKLFNGMNPDYQ